MNISKDLVHEKQSNVTINIGKTLLNMNVSTTKLRNLNFKCLFQIHGTFNCNNDCQTYFDNIWGSKPCRYAPIH